MIIIHVSDYESKYSIFHNVSIIMYEMTGDGLYVNSHWLQFNKDLYSW